MENLQDQMSTGRRINKPSDDPIGISFSMRYRSELEANDQYQSNVDSALSWLNYTDTMMDQMGSVLHRARELAVQGANGASSVEATDSMRLEIEQLYNQMTTIGNSQFNGKYVFNGQLTDQKPFPDPDNAAGATPDNGEIQFEIGLGVKLSVNKTAEQVFGPTGNNVFSVLKDLIGELKNYNTDGVSQSLGAIDIQMDRLLGARADIGAKTNRIELAEDRLKDIDVNLQTLKSKTEDADMTQVITNLKMDENVYQASLSAGAKLIRPSLLDFLR